MGRSTWDVFFSLPKLTPELSYSNRAESGGVTYVAGNGDRVVVINANMSKLDQDIALYHELCGHAALWGARIAPGTEERILRAQSRNAWLALRSLGFSWPARPKGLAKLERSAA